MNPLLKAMTLMLMTFWSMGKPPPETPNDRRLPPAERAACLARGGYVERMGMAGFEGCVDYYKDAGKVCTDKAQCQGLCIYQGDPQRLPKPLTGNCAPTSNRFGCYTFIDKGKLNGICVD